MSSEDENIVDLPLAGHKKETPARILRACAKENIKDVLVIGYTDEDELFFCHNLETIGEILLLLKQTELYFLMGDDD